VGVRILQHLPPAAAPLAKLLGGAALDGMAPVIDPTVGEVRL
jgi:hypothetical protein